MKRPVNPLFVSVEFLLFIGDSVRILLAIVIRLITASLFFATDKLLTFIRTVSGIRIPKVELPKFVAPKKTKTTKRTSGKKRALPVATWRRHIVSSVMTYWASVDRLISRMKLPNISLRTFPKLPALPRLQIPKFPQVRPRRFTYSLPKRGRIFPAPALGLEKLRWFIYGATCVILVLVPWFSHRWLRELPNPKLLSTRDISVTTKILDRNGVLLYEIYADQNRTPVPLKNIPDIVQKATIAIEDKNFYLHQGYSVWGIARAIREILLHRKIQGGSTITQQLIKSALLTPEVSLSRKLKELVLAVWAEQMYSKSEILEMYLNQVPYGGAAWGVEAAARMYFGKSITDVTLAQAALLAGLPAAPTSYSPYGTNPEAAFGRQREVLRRMVEDRYITQQEADQALSEPVHVVPPKTAIRAPHFVMYIRKLLEERYGPRLVAGGGLRIKTSLDIAVQEQVENIVRSNIESLGALRVGNGASLVTDPKTGDILAMVGSRDYFGNNNFGNVNVTTTLQQPGSAIKVVTYAAGLESGMTAATVLDDSPVVFHSPGSPDYAPVNYDGQFHGKVPLRYALGNSYNIPAVRVLAAIGVPTMIDKGRQMGIRSWGDASQYGLSLTLGGGEVTMLEIATVFGTLANTGNRISLRPILEISDYTGRIIERTTIAKPVRAISPEVAWILTDILSDNQARTQAFGPSSSLVITGHTVAVKTGTSNDKRDNWTVGYTPSMVVTVWVGNNDNSPMHPLLTSGVTGAAPIWHDIVTELLKGKPNEEFRRPANIVEIPCHFGRIEYFVKGTQPSGGRCAAIPTPTPSVSPTP